MARRKFLGCQFPLVKGPRGILAQKSGVDQIKADLIQLLLTNPGERVMLPQFGVPLRRLQFQPNDPLLEMEAKRMIAEAIKLWEPRVQIANIVVTSEFDESYGDEADFHDELGSILFIRIAFYDPQEISEIQELDLQVSVGGV